ncbi:MAG: tRNA (adenosine(37)-N6)-dimethylallyltransferase MiaA [Chloroflexi bacterium]|nr:tRNA (adenosine(37)-N6)-dimethylallyltransferase MiaA [Chloroflexota bacterium]
MRPLVAIVGPTAVGKTDLGIRLALSIGGEIVNADSRQVYRYMDVGTAKPSAEQRSKVTHYLLDIVSPDEPFSLALYQELAFRAIDDITARGKVPVVVGGTGLYVWALLEKWSVPRVAPDRDYRKSMEELAAREGSAHLYRQLVEVDPTAAERIDPRNTRRIIRALEVCRGTKRSVSALQAKRPLPHNCIIIGLTMPRERLYKRIDERVDRMIREGLIDEVKGLVQRGYGFDLPPMSGIGYKEIALYLESRLDLESATQRIKYRTHHLARRQYAWFRLDDPRIHWLNLDNGGPEAQVAVEELVRW